MKSYKDIEAWQLNQNCIRSALKVIEELPQTYAMQHIGKQLFRAISCVGADIAEGQDSDGDREFLRYLNGAIRSAIESDYWLSTLEGLLESPHNLKKLKCDNSEVISALKDLRNSIEKEEYAHSSEAMH